MVPNEVLTPDLDWLAATGDKDDSWLGPGPKLINLEAWLERLALAGHPVLVTASYAAANAALPHWTRWLLRSKEFALQSILDGRPPQEQLAAVSQWLDAPTIENQKRALDTVDHTKQLHWFHEEYCDRWFSLPGVWAVESSEHCVLTLTGAPYSRTPHATLASLSVACAINSFRKSIEDPIRDSLERVVKAIQFQLFAMK